MMVFPNLQVRFLFYILLERKILVLMFFVFYFDVYCLCFPRFFIFTDDRNILQCFRVDFMERTGFTLVSQMGQIFCF